jgi:hypothetical protein
MLEALPDESGVKTDLLEFFKQNPATQAALTQAAKRAKLTQSSSEDVVHLRTPIHALHYALMSEGNFDIDVNLTGKSAAFISEEGSTSFKSKKKRHQQGSSFYEEICEQRTAVLDEHLALRAKKDVLTQAVKCDVGSLECKSYQGRCNDDELTLKAHDENTAPGVHETKNQTRSIVSEFIARSKLSFQALLEVALNGTQAKAREILVQAVHRVNVLGAHDTDDASSTAETKTGWWFFGGKKTETHSESSSQFKAASLTAETKVQLQAAEVNAQAPEIKSPETEIAAKRLTIQQGKNTKASASNMRSENALWMSGKSQEQQDETHTQASFTGKVKLNVQELELEQVRGQVLNYLDQLDYEKSPQLKIITTLLDELHHRKETSISAPGPALIAAVAVISSLATAGVGGAAAVGLGLKAGMLATSATSAAISSITAQVATQVALGVLSQQSIGDIIKQITRPETFKNAAVSALTAGALSEVHGLQELAGTGEILRKVENAGVQSGIGLCANAVCGEQSLGDALQGAGVQFVSQSASSIAAREIGHFYAKSEGPWARGLHKLAHGVSAAAVAAGGAAILGQDVGTAVAGAAAGAMTAEIVAEMLTQPLKQEYVEEIQKQQTEQGRLLTPVERKAVWDSKMSDVMKISELTGALSGLISGDARGVSAAGTSSSTALNNNFLVAAAPLLWAAAEAALAELGTTGVVVASAAAGGYALHKATEGDGDSAGEKAADAAGGRLKVMKPIQEANGTSHTTIKRDPKTGKVSNYETWEPNPKNPTGYDSQKRVDTQHAKPHSHGGVDTPHVHEKGSKMPRPALPTELPK